MKLCRELGNYLRSHREGYVDAHYNVSSKDAGLVSSNLESKISPFDFLDGNWNPGIGGAMEAIGVVRMLRGRGIE